MDSDFSGDAEWRENVNVFSFNIIFQKVEKEEEKTNNISLELS